MIISKSDKKLQDIKNRGALLEGNYLQTASDIINNVIKNGDTALFEYTKKFDKFDINKVILPFLNTLKSLINLILIRII